jgi:preprotein translocase subunit SecF
MDMQNMLSNKVGKENVEILKTDIVGPKAGAQLRISGFQAMFWALLGIMIYLALRFDYKYAPGAIAALIHDVTFIIGAFILTQREFSLQIVAALLAIIGYSVNDTVVIYDRVRELEAANPTGDMNKTINRAINETMSRTILTAGTVFIVSVVMMVMGGGVIHDFFFALTIGTVSGTYSTVFIASPITLWLDKVMNQKQAKKISTTKSMA